MSKLQGLDLPSEYREAFQALAAAEPGDVDSIIHRLGQPPLPVDRNELSELFSTAVGAQGRVLLEALVSLLAVMRFLETTASELADAVTKADDLELSDDVRRQLRIRVEGLLGAQTLLVVDRAQDLLREVPHSFVHARIITDIRPLFVASPPAPPSGAVITETLRLEYRREYGEREVSTLFLALNDGDIDAIQRALNRARDKMESLKRFLGTAGLPHVELYVEGNG